MTSIEVTPTYRSISRRAIIRVMQENPQANRGALRKLLSNAYPFGSKRNLALRIWVFEVSKALKQVEE